MNRFVTAAIISAVMLVGIASAQVTPAKIILLVGPPGSGKTTQAKLLAKKYAILAFSMADLLKKQMSAQKKDPVTKALKASIASG